MNASFRTAFWALCLGLTVPMVLFVGARLTTHGLDRRAAAMVAADRAGSLRTRLETGAGKSSGGSGAAISNSNGTPTPPRDQVVLDPPEADPNDAQVVLGPGLELDPTAPEAVASRDRRVPANAVAETRPKVRAVPDIESVQTAHAATALALEARLAGIQQNLDKLGRAIDAQSNREPAGDPIKQATDLLKQLQEARLIPSPASQSEGPLALKPGNDDSSSGRKESSAPSPVTDTSSDPSSPEPRTQKAEPQPETATRIYRPRYLSGSALHALIEPLLTPNLGRAGAADSAAADGAAAGNGSSAAAPADALVVCDQPEVLRKIDLLYQKLDTAPAQVVIEVVVLCLGLNQGMPNGIDLLAFDGVGQPFTVSAADAGFAYGNASPADSAFPPDDPLLLTRKYGLKRCLLSGDPAAFISALQSAAQTRRVDAWQMTVANRQPADLMLIDPFGPGGSSDQIAAGTILKIRPIVSRQNTIHLDVRRDLALDLTTGGTRAAALTNQFSLHDGQTAVIGGFFAEQSAIQYYRPAGIGEVPVIGGLFRRQAPAVDRTETIILLTPHVVRGESDSQASRKSRPADEISKTTTGSVVPASATVPHKPVVKSRRDQR